MSDPIIIRPPVLSDKPAWTELWRGYLEFYETTLPDRIYDVTFDRLLSDDHPDQNAFLAVAGETPVGLVHYIFHPHNWREEKICYLQDLFATPETRGTGVGRKLIEAVYDAADARGCPVVYWMTQDFNETARKLYDRIGVLTPFIKYTRP